MITLRVTAAIDANLLRTPRDNALYAELLAHPDIQRVISAVEKQELSSPTGVRRQLLATALKLTPAMSPEIKAMIDDCQTRLRLEGQIEAYVYPSSNFNAAAVKSRDKKLVVMFSSSLLEAFRGNELKFVIGHELGHHFFDHHGIPIGRVLRGKQRPPADLALKLFAWSRYAEISADRAGAFCAQDNDAVATALFRLASGLKGDFINIKIDDFAAQFDDMASGVKPATVSAAPSQDWFLTHPFSPLRLKALHAFAASHFIKAGGTSSDELETQTHNLMAMMEPSYLQDKSPEAETMRRLLLAGCIAVANADGDISPEEVELIEQSFGKGTLDNLNAAAIVADLDDRIKAARDLKVFERAHVLRDIAVIARADGQTHPDELAMLARIADSLEVENQIYEAVLCQSCELD